MPDVGDHYRPREGSRTSDADADDPDADDPDADNPDADDAVDGRDSAVYRVVGASDEVALLRVTDADGRRAHTGDLRRVSPEEFDDEFEPAADPDAGVTPVADLRNALSGLYWQFRRFL